MPRFAANLSTMYQEHEFLDRFAAAAADGFAAVEYLFPYAFPAGQLRDRLTDCGLTQVLFNAPPGDWAAGERGLASVPGRHEQFRAGLQTALEYAAELGCPRVHVMAGLVPVGAGADERAARWAAYRENLEWAAERAAPAGVSILVEPINHRDMPGYLLSQPRDAQALVRRLGTPNVTVQLDLYHAQITHGDLTTLIRELVGADLVGHVQIAGVPDRHEPDEGELDHEYLFALLDEIGYRGWVGCEYRPRGATSAGLGWFARYRRPGRSAPGAGS